MANACIAGHQRPIPGTRYPALLSANPRHKHDIDAHTGKTPTGKQKTNKKNPIQPNGLENVRLENERSLENEKMENGT